MLFRGKAIRSEGHFKNDLTSTLKVRKKVRGLGRGYILGDYMEKKNGSVLGNGKNRGIKKETVNKIIQQDKY